MILLFCWTKGFSYPAHTMKVKKMVKALVAITLVFHIIQLYLQIFLELLRGFSFALIDVTFQMSPTIAHHSVLFFDVPREGFL